MAARINQAAPAQVGAQSQVAFSRAQNQFNGRLVVGVLLPASAAGYSVYTNHKSFDEFTALYDWRAKAYRVAELKGMPIRMRAQADCTLEISMLEESGMTRLEHGMNIKLYEQQICTAPKPECQNVPEGFDYSELRHAINRITRELSK